jgi:hypothetical protein
MEAYRKFFQAASRLAMCDLAVFLTGRLRFETVRKKNTDCDDGYDLSRS